MNTFVRCGSLFTGREDEAQPGGMLVFDREGRLLYTGAEAGAPRRAKADRLIDHSGHFVMPGMIDVHTHLAYGNAKSEEDIDLYSPLEFRALRGLFFAQKVAGSGYTAVCSPGDAGQISLSIRDAIRAGLFDGPRVMAAGPYLTTHQGLTDWYPTWIGAPETSIGKLVTNINEAVEEVRRQVKNGVDCVKIALDGIQRRPDGELIAAFTQEETDVIVRESHRLGRKAISHSVGREATLYAARAGVDLIFHGFDLDEECIAAMLESGSALCPTLTHPRNTVDFAQPHDPAFLKGRVDQTERRYRLGIARLKNARFMTEGDQIGVLEPGRAADFIVLDGSPLADIRVLQYRRRLHAVYIAGKELKIADRPYDPRQVTDFALSNWTDLYTQARVAELGIGERRSAAE